MQAESSILQRLTHAYATYRAVRSLCMLAVPGAAVLLFVLSGGFPPWAWRLLVQTIPHVSTLLAEHGQVVLLAFAGLVLLAITLVLAWWALLWLAWRMLAYEFSERRELERFAAEMQEAHDLVQEEQAYYASDYASTAQEQAMLYADYVRTQYDEVISDDEDEAAAFATDEDASHRPFSTPLPLVSAQSTPRNVRFAVSSPPMTAFAAQVQRIDTDTLPDTRRRVQTGDLRSTREHVQTGDLPATRSRVQTGDLRSTREHVQTGDLPQAKYGLLPPVTMPEPQAARETLVLLDNPNYTLTSVPTIPLTPAPVVAPEALPARSAIQLAVSTGLDVGLKRKGRPNEDSLLAVQNTRLLRGSHCPVGLFVIADGMGGHDNGQEASRLVIQSLSTTVAPSLATGPADDNYAELLAEGVHRANLALYQRNRQKQTDMGTTLTAALIVNTTAYIANVGDSRVYLYRASCGLSQVTRDHSTVALLVEKGALQPEEIYTHPRRNEIYRSLGHQASQDVDSFILAVQPGDLLMLCSDGLWEMVRDPQIEEILASESQQPAQLSAALVQAALDGGGKDNISVIVVGVQMGQEVRAVWAS